MASTRWQRTHDTRLAGVRPRFYRPRAGSDSRKQPGRQVDNRKQTRSVHELGLAGEKCAQTIRLPGKTGRGDSVSPARSGFRWPWHAAGRGGALFRSETLLIGTAMRKPRNNANRASHLAALHVMHIDRLTNVAQHGER